jgi:hypothetical protein
VRSRVLELEVETRQLVDYIHQGRG